MINDNKIPEMATWDQDLLDAAIQKLERTRQTSI